MLDEQTIKRCGVLSLLLTACTACAGGAPSVPTSEDAVDASLTISASDLYDKIGVLAHDSMRGRDTPSPELDAAAEWVASELEAYGLAPAFESGGYIQRYAIQRVAPDFGASRARSSNGVPLAFGPDLGFPFGSSGDRDLEGAVAVLTGSEAWDAAVGGLNLVDKHVIVVPAASGASQGRAAFRAVRALRGRGALSLWVASDDSDADWGGATALQELNSSLRVGNDGGASPMLAIRDGALQRLLGSSGFDVADARSGADGPVALTDFGDVRVSLTVRARVMEEQTAPNVAAVLPGSDPALADEHIVFSAHLDHVGVGAPDANGDSIRNGADDDASGSAVIMEIAEAFASLPLAPRRSMLFLWVSGEEKGLWGSRYFADNSPVPIEQVVANLNADMVGRNWSDTIVVIGKEHSDLGRTMNEVNQAHPEIGMTAIDDIWPDENFYSRSDHYNFARKGVPVLFFFNGTHEDYHRPSDELDKIDTEKAARIGRLMFYLGLEVGNRNERPQWNPESRQRIVTDG